ncbi:MAG TPA: GDSL-type esterase/lipase family protein [Bryobacteraceae bacterium]|nr:GDSL-type esterase/lipase family protein [Bryobacteraceae bacterium]
MRLWPALLLTSILCAQQSPPANPAGALLGAKDAGELTTRMMQLMESTAVAVPDLVRASEPVNQNVQTTLRALSANPQSPALTWQFMNQIRAYLALSDSMPRPYPFPPAAEKQFAELHEDLDRLQQHFIALLAAGSVVDQKRTADPNDLNRYADADSKLLPPDKMPRVVFLGDSITEAWRLNEYFTGHDFVNRGIAAQTTSQMLARFRQDVIGLNPKAVVILGGTDDIAAGTAPRQIEDNLAMMADLAKQHGIRAIFASILPVSDYHKDIDPRYEMTKNRPPATIQAINKWIQTLCLTGGFVWMDYYTAMVDPMGYMKTDLSDDGLHPNAKGYRVMSPVTLETIDRVLSRQPQDTEENKRRFKLLGR